MLKYVADFRAVLFMITVTGLLFLQWNLESFNIGLWLAAMFMAVTVTTIAHNHNHVPMWRSKTMNVLTDYWLTNFYGFPAFAWIPTHNLNHHKLTNKEGDYTITYRFSENNNMITLLRYPLISAYFQQTPTSGYLKKLWDQNRSRFWYCMTQYALWAGCISFAIYMDTFKGFMYFVIPAQFGLFMVLIFNYIQHIHCDELHRWNHSRNFVSPIMNFWLLNNGYHTAHHEKMGMHWSLLKAEHEKTIVPNIDPRLNEPSFFGYIIKQYILAPFIPKLGTRNFRSIRISETGS